LRKLFGPIERAGLKADLDLSGTPDLKHYKYAFTQAKSELYLVQWSQGGSLAR